MHDRAQILGPIAQRRDNGGQRAEPPEQIRAETTVAGVGNMPFARFVGFSIAGGVLWVFSLSYAGYFFGNVPIVKKHFELVVLVIVGISVIPVVIHALRSRRSPAQVEPKAAP